MENSLLPSRKEFREVMVKLGMNLDKDIGGVDDSGHNIVCVIRYDGGKKEIYEVNSVSKEYCLVEIMDDTNSNLDEVEKTLDVLMMRNSMADIDDILKGVSEYLKQGGKLPDCGHIDPEIQKEINKVYHFKNSRELIVLSGRADDFFRAVKDYERKDPEPIFID